MLALPLTAFVPLQAPEAVQEVAFVEVHVKVEPAPLVTLVGLALIDTVGLLAAPLPLMVTMADLVEPNDAPSAPARAIATVLLPVNVAVLLMGITNDFGDASPLPQLRPPWVDV